MPLKSVLPVLLLLVTVCCRAQDTLAPADVTVFYYPSGVKSSEGRMVNGKPDGWWRSYNEKGQLVSEGNRKDFLLDSLWTFYAEGKPYLTINYKAGEKHGEQVQYASKEYTKTQWRHDTIVGTVNTYDQVGWLKRTVPYEAGKPHGLAKEYNQEGRVVAITSYYHGVMSRSERINRIDDFGYKQGNWKYFWPNGNIRLEGTYLNDKKNGFFKYYDENGNFLSVEKYDHDELVKDAKETRQLDKRTAYHSNGRPSIVATYYQNKPEGIRREFDTAGHITKGYVFADGILRYEGITDMNGLRQGIWKEYYPSGELRSQGRYKNSRPIGEWLFFFEDKTVEIQGEYNSKGQKTGEWVWFYPNGDTMSKATYDDGDLDGEYVEYDEHGKPLVKGQYVAGLEEGNWYYRNGTSEETGKYEGGRKEGLWTTTYEPGKVAFKIQYRQDVRDGKYTAFWENGNVKVSGKYEDGLQESAWSYYNEEGIQFLTTLFKEGKELKWNNYTIK